MNKEIKTNDNVDIKLGNFKDKTIEELEIISNEYNKEQERLFNVHTLGNTKEQDEPVKV